MATATQPSTTSPPSNAEASDVPPLENGDRLSCAEFERRYDAMPHLKKSELIEGVVYMGSPVSDEHAKSQFDLILWLGLYRIETPGILGGDNGTVRLDLDNMHQPDAFLRILTNSGGVARVGGDGYLAGAPELVAEIATSSASIDLHAKLHVYRRNGVRDYLVWRTRDRALDWFILHEGQYRRLEPSTSGVLKSLAFPGLWLDAAALTSGDMAAVSLAAREGLASPEHAAFVEQLRGQAPGEAD